MKMCKKFLVFCSVTFSCANAKVETSINDTEKCWTIAEQKLLIKIQQGEFNDVKQILEQEEIGNEALNTCLIYASKHWEMVQYFFDQHGEQINQASIDHSLLCAVHCDSVETLKILKEKVNSDRIDEACRIAASCGRLISFQYLMQFVDYKKLLDIYVWGSDKVLDILNKYLHLLTIKPSKYSTQQVKLIS